MSKNIRLSIPGMKCSGGVSAIKTALSDEVGVTRADVELDTRTALGETNSELSVLPGALKTAGFDATEVVSA